MFSLLAALVVFKFLTRRLQTLAESVDSFRASGFAQPVQLSTADQSGDEIDRLSAAFQEMSERIATQLKQLERVDIQRRELLAPTFLAGPSAARKPGRRDAWRSGPPGAGLHW